MMRLALPLLSLLLALPAAAQSAKELNTTGFHLYQAGKYAEALEKFRAATQVDPKHALAQYNVAATLGVLRKQGKVCDYNAYRETILQYLTAAVKLDPKRLTRAKEDPDLDPIRDTVGWQRLLGRSPTRAADVPEILRQVSWFGPGVGVWGTLVTIRFEQGGKAVLTRKTPQDEGPPKPETLTGTYSVKGSRVEVVFPGEKPDSGSLDAQGTLTFKKQGRFTDSPSECEA
jgi:tetratricopeptide (TPR) repeat protein